MAQHRLCGGNRRSGMFDEVQNAWTRERERERERRREREREREGERERVFYWPNDYQMIENFRYLISLFYSAASISKQPRQVLLLSFVSSSSSCGLSRGLSDIALLESESHLQKSDD